ncbi:hypothetical protein [Bradyrhizobium oligotrophicum]|uniref:hypothetical protein n=1 Tax=Bradyrhizobium oligotrophicum TaxID=44255 RepID=UPI00034869AA|nr:hypothetical protein [Bradyrhizobium oligotrophicum]
MSCRLALDHGPAIRQRSQGLPHSMAVHTEGGGQFISDGNRLLDASRTICSNNVFSIR